MPNAFPITPIAGPPVHWPIASAWLVIEKTVARTLESSMLWLSHDEKSGPASERETPATIIEANASTKLPASAKTTAAPMRTMSSVNSTRVTVRRGASSSRLFTGRATTIESAIPQTAITPNQTTEPEPRKLGRPTSRRR